ncbi:MAG: shikimate dehydrogenase [Bacteroidaceae bacterium]|nr:shikimate dehydrogenase [Bacteroidaceae bacterium]
MDKYGLFGYPLGHSFSRKFFTDKFNKEAIDAEYLNFEIPSIDSYLDVLDSNPELKGHNVTIPYKQQIMPYLNDITEEARAIGAVNVVRVGEKDGKRFLKGYNSDVIGFVNSLKPLLKSNHKKALILGTGGASKAVKYGLEQKLGIETLYVSRTAKPGMITYDDVTADLIHDYQVIINCSPCGMFPHVDECPQLPYEAMNGDNLLFDLVYNPEETKFMRLGAQNGAVVKNGLEMLILQAVASWEFWNEK